jgi:chorismate mutase
LILLLLPLCIGRSAGLSPASQFSLASVRQSLIRQEETIIFALIERAQFRRNDAIYQAGMHRWDADAVDPWLVEDGSFLSFMLLETEKVHARARRYTSPEEHAFFPRLLATTEPVLPVLEYPPVLVEQSININDQVLRLYIDNVVPSVCDEGDDEQHGSSALCDIACLQALSRRIHIGKFVAESKYQAEPEKFSELVKARNVVGINELLTNDLVEDRVCHRARLKAVAFGQDAFSDKDAGFKVSPNDIVELYRDMIIPLTKQVQVRYLFERVGIDAPDESEWPGSLLGFTGSKQTRSTKKRAAMWM